MDGAMSRAVRAVSELHPGDTVEVTTVGAKPLTMTVTGGPRRGDGAFGSPESTRVTVSLGPGRYSMELTADQVAKGSVSFRRVGGRRGRGRE